MKEIDVIILTNTASDEYFNLLKITIESIKAQTDVKSNIILVETNKLVRNKEVYGLDIDNLVIPDETFHFNRFLNHGLKYSKSDYVCFSNNDVYYFPYSLFHLIEAMQEYDSVSPFGLGYSNGLDEKKIISGYELNRLFFGWSFCFTRKTINKCFNGSFDERFAFYRSDLDIVETLKLNNFKHGAVGNAKAAHLNLKGEPGTGRNSYVLLGENSYFYTEHPEQNRIFHEKWNKKV